MHKIEEFLKKGFLISPDVFDEINEKDTPNYSGLVIEKKTLENIKKIDKGVSKKSFAENNIIEIIQKYEEKDTKITINDFVNLYNDRLNFLQNILIKRQELQNTISIKKAQTIPEQENVSIIGIINEILNTKNNNIKITLEDQTGKISAIITKKAPELTRQAKELTPDEVIGIQGIKGDNIIFVNSVIFPDIPLTKELKKSPFDHSAIFISDLHIGSKAFMQNSFEKFLEWINKKVGSEKHKEMANKVKYIFLVGDLVEGIGIYPDQEKDLLIKDIYEQYNLLCDYLNQIPEDKYIILCPGNHDTLRIAEPQPPIPKEFLKNLKREVILLSSPGYIKIDKTENFEGLLVLLYHGFSFPYYADTIEPIRLEGGLKITDKIMELLLKKRHLAPTHGSTQYQLGYNHDPLIIRNVPDFFVSGHIHRATIKNYRNVTMLNCSCWVTQTEYQEKRGLEPQPARVIYVDLKTRESKIINFE